MMRITLNQLRAFRHIVEAGTFNAAAIQLGLSQPSISQRIRELESTLDSQLFVRRGPKVDLTIEGRALIDYANKMLAVESEIIDRFESRDPLKGILRLGVTDSFAIICLVDLIRGLEEQYPSLKVSVTVDNSNTLTDLLNDQVLDIAVLSGSKTLPNVRKISVGTNEMAWLVGPGIYIPARRTTPKDLINEHIMVSSPPSLVYSSMMAWFSEAGVEPSRVSTCNNLSAAILSIKSGVAIGIVPTRVVAKELSQNEIVRLRCDPEISSHEYHICYQTAAVGSSIEAAVALAQKIIEGKKMLIKRPTAISH